MIQRTKFHGVSRPPQERQIRTEIIEPIGGLNHQRPATNLKPGETPFSQNFVMGDRYMQPRSGCSQWGTTSLTSTPLGFASAFRLDRTEVAFLISANTASICSNTLNWTAIAQSGARSDTTSGYYSIAAFFDPSSTIASRPHLIVVNKDSFPRSLGIASASLDTFTYSFGSYARYVAAFDNRAVFFHSGSTLAPGSLINATRVGWSARGNPSAFTNAGGFQDLVDMQGSGTALIAERDRLVLLSDKETWGGNPRRDDFAFDFFVLDKGKGCPAANDRTPKNTEAGTIWLGAAQQFYRLTGNEVRALGDKVRSVLQTELREAPLAFSIYNPQDHVYGYFYSDTTGEYPTKALFLRTDTIHPVDTSRDDGTWFLQDWGTSFQFILGGVFNGDTVLISSNGTAYRLLSTQTNDAGTAIDCRWRSHALRAEKDLFPYEALQELWLEHESTSTGTVSVFQSTDNGATFTSVGTASLTSGIGYPFVPVTAAAARNQMFEIRLNDGSQPKLGRFELTLRGYSGRFSGAP